MTWLLREGEVLAALEDRSPGWRQDPRGAVLVTPPALVHTLRRPSGFDVARCRPVGGTGGKRMVEVLRTSAVGARRLYLPGLGVPGWRRSVLVVAPRGAFERWRLTAGDRLEVSGE